MQSQLELQVNFLLVANRSILHSADKPCDFQWICLYKTFKNQDLRVLHENVKVPDI